MANTIRATSQAQTANTVSPPPALKKLRETFYLKFYGDKWRAGTVSLSLEAKGMYIDIISLMWDRKDGLPACPLALSRLLKIDPRVCRRVLEVLIKAGKLRVEGAYLTNKRMGHEIAVYLSAQSKVDAAPADDENDPGFQPDDDMQPDLFADATGGRVDTTTSALPANFRQKSSHIFLESSTKSTLPPLQLESESKDKRNRTSTAAPVPGSAAPPDPLLEKLIEGAGQAIDVNAPGIRSGIEPRAWLANGCDLEADVIPALQAVAARPRRAKIVSWQYFTQAVAEARAARLEPLAVASVETTRQRPTAAASTTPKWLVEKRARIAECHRINEVVTAKYAVQQAAADAAHAVRIAKYNAYLGRAS